MYALVRTSKQQKDFEKTWEYFCEKYKWVNDPYAKNGVRYNIIVPSKTIFKRKQTIGTIEFIPYNPKSSTSTVEPSFKYSNFDEIRVNQHRIWEIDKVCIHEQFQRKGYLEIYKHILYEHTMEHNPKYYLGLVEKKFFRMLRMYYGAYVQQKGEALVGPRTSLIPTILNIEGAMEDGILNKSIATVKQDRKLSVN